MRRIFLTAMMILPAVAATAAELDTSLGGHVEYDSNVFRSTFDERDDVIFRLDPQVTLREDHGEDLNYSLWYRMPFSLAVENDAVNGLDHVANAKATYRPDDRLKVDLKDYFAYVRSAQLTSADSGFATEISTRRQRVLHNDGDLSANYLFTPRLSGDARVVGSYFNPVSIKNRSETYGVTGVGDLAYAINAQHNLAGGVAVTYQKFLRSRTVLGSETDYVNGFLQWTWQYDDQTLFRVGAGPTWIQTKLQGQSTRTSSVTVFGNALLSRRWSPTLITALSYERKQGGASGLGGSVVQDYVYATGNWDFTERWQLALRADYVLRQSVATQRLSVPAVLLERAVLIGVLPAGLQGLVPPRTTGRIDSTRWGVSGRLTHRMTKHFRTYLDVRYNRQVSQGATLGSTTDFSDFVTTLGVDYSFDPLHLW